MPGPASLATAAAQTTRHGTLPPQMAALCAPNMAMFDLGAQAVIERSVEKAIYALMLDPLLPPPSARAPRSRR